VALLSEQIRKLRVKAETQAGVCTAVSFSETDWTSRFHRTPERRSRMLPGVIGGPAGCLGSFDDFVGAGEQGRRNGEAQCIRGLESDHQLKLRRL
jgi:hypothetical protein